MLQQFYVQNGFDFASLAKTISALICNDVDLTVVYVSNDLQASSRNVTSLDVCTNISNLFWFGPHPFKADHFDYLCARIPISIFERPTDSLEIRSLAAERGFLDPMGFRFTPDAFGTDLSML